MTQPALQHQAPQLLRQVSLRELVQQRMRDGRTRGEHWKSDPCVFFRDVFGVEPWEHLTRDSQGTLLRAVAKHRFVAARSAHKTGKTLSLGGLAIWWAVTQGQDARVIITSPGYNNIKKTVWPEVQRLYLRALKRGITLGPPPALDPGTGLVLGPRRGVFGISTDSPERMSGLSGDKLMFLVDEASGYDESIIASVFGNISGGGKVVLTGNPTHTSGTFFEAFHNRRQAWNSLLHLRAQDTPNFAPGAVLVPGLASPSTLEFYREIWGEGTPQWQARVDGNFPSNVANAVFGLALIEKGYAATRFATDDNGDVICIGVDPARFGDDDSVIMARAGKRMLPCTALHGYDVVRVAAAVAQCARDTKRKLKRDPQEKCRAHVDTCGVGAGVADYLRVHYGEELLVLDVNAGAKSDDDENFVNLRAQLWFAGREWLEAGGALCSPPDRKLEAELTAATYDLDARGRKRVEAKEKMKERIGRSPDRADAFCLACYSPPLKKKARAAWGGVAGGGSGVAGNYSGGGGFDDRGFG